MSGGGSFSSDQTTLNLAVIATNTQARVGRTRITSIQGYGVAASTLLIYNVAAVGDAAAGNLVATYKFGTEGLEVYVPGSGILCDQGIAYNLVGAGGSVTLTITGG